MVAKALRGATLRLVVCKPASNALCSSGADGRANDASALSAVTHGHRDHVEGLQALFARWPSAQLAYHELEHPFLTGPPPSSIQPASVTWA